jgi:hypothetical protein
MSFILRLLFLLLFQSAYVAHAQTTGIYQYQMDGTFQGTVPEGLRQADVTFNLIWREINGRIEGTYRDNYFVNNTPITGTAGLHGRVFIVEFPRVIQGVSSLSITTNMVNLQSGTAPIMVLMRDPGTRSLSQANISATVGVISQAPEVQSNCDIGFGALTEFCGLYAGRIQEVSDTSNRCNLPDYGFRMELNTDAKFNMYFYYSDNTVGIPVHELNSLPNPPLSPVVNLTTRHCGTLVGTGFNPENCQALRLEGRFEDNGGLRSFRGTYLMTDEISNESCQYELVLEREKGY